MPLNHYLKILTTLAHDFDVCLMSFSSQLSESVEMKRTLIGDMNAQ